MVSPSDFEVTGRVGRFLGGWSWVAVTLLSEGALLVGDALSTNDMLAQVRKLSVSRMKSSGNVCINGGHLGRFTQTECEAR